METFERKFPYAETDLTKYIDWKVKSIEGLKSEQEIPTEISYGHADAIKRLRTGEESLHLAFVGRLARALGIPPIVIFRMLIEQRWPELVDDLEMEVGWLATPFEVEFLLKPWREITKDRDANIPSPIREVVGKMFSELRRVAHNL